MATVGEPMASAPKTGDTEQAKSPEGKTEYISYTGGASRREITVADWKKAGVTGMKEDINFTFMNGFKLPKSDFSESALKYLLGERRTNGSRSFKSVTE